MRRKKKSNYYKIVEPPPLKWQCYFSYLQKARENDGL